MTRQHKNHRNLRQPEIVATAISILLAILVPGTSRADEAQVERGRYLVQIAGCSDCHTPGHFLGQPDPARFLGGSDVGFEIPGVGIVYGPNLTPDATGLGAWTADQIVATYTFSDADAVKYLTQLDRLGVIELRPMNRYRLLLAKTFRWRPHGPVMSYFREHVVDDYFDTGFDAEGELLMLVHGQIGRSLANAFNERLARVAQDFAQQHLADQKLPAEQKRPYTLLIGMRSWLFEAFRDLKRVPGSE